MFKKLLLLMALCFTQTADARPIIRELEDKGEVVGAGTCTMADARFDCVQVTYEGNLYSVLGTIKGDEFFALYVMKQVKEEWLMVWSWKADV